MLLEPVAEVNFALSSVAGLGTLRNRTLEFEDEAGSTVSEFEEDERVDREPEWPMSSGPNPDVSKPEGLRSAIVGGSNELEIRMELCPCSM